MGALRQSFKQWRDENSLSVDSKMAKRLNTALANLTTKEGEKPNGMRQREGAESLVSVFKGGGQVTKASQELLLKHLSGIVGDAETWLSERSSGTYGDRDLEVLRAAAKGALAEQAEQMKSYYQSAKDTFGPGSGWENLGGNINHMIKGEFRQFGIDAPDIYGEAPTVTLGSGERPKPIKKTPPNKIVDAAKVQSLPPEDQAAVKMARDRLAKNPNDTIAKQVLQLHGL